MKNILHNLEEKKCAVQNIIWECESKRSLLNENLVSVKEAITKSFKRHVSSLESRANLYALICLFIYFRNEGNDNDDTNNMRFYKTNIKSHSYNTLSISKVLVWGCEYLIN